MMNRRTLIGTALFCGAMAFLLFLRLLPLSAGTVRLPGPDLGLCLTLAWVLRRPDQIAAPVIALVFVVQDIILFNPLGLWPAIVLIGSEAARLRDGRWRDAPFMVEWLRIAILIGLMMLGYRVLQVLFMMPVPALGQAILHFIATVVAYPPVVLAARALVGLRRITPAEAEQTRFAR
ncbi:rod shape-determining protein MreD [Paracoccus sediminis]|uniref:Rod shape-determining protein MreD n=1 Tax=Paracoccus sediminis TaxID=1214787 RepID=A0A238X6T1_9RHOB|nr:rod shape-determining protein MreD [Paracoccus sediminis]TBN49014.1 rod shape-determining protein MreD [Paracoccus sediminis]SNR54288.1 rod shape-determining protein MreD [Paracoccus sediminis]